MGVSHYYVQKLCPDLCAETVYRYLRGDSDGCGRTISDIMEALELRVSNGKTKKKMAGRR